MIIALSIFVVILVFSCRGYKSMLNKAKAENKQLKEAIEWAVERMDEEPAKVVLTKALQGKAEE